MATDAQIDIGISVYLWPGYFCDYQVEPHRFVRFIYAICEFFYPISSGITMNPAEFIIRMGAVLRLSRSNE